MSYVEPEVARQRLAQMMQRLLGRLREHLASVAGPLVLAKEEALVTGRWLWSFEDFHRDLGRYTTAEWMFVVLCHLVVCKERPSLLAAPAAVLVQRWDEQLRLWGTPLSPSWPTTEELSSAWSELGCLVVYVWNQGPGAVEQLTEPATPGALAPVIEQLRQIEVMRRPDESDEEFGQRPNGVPPLWWVNNWQQRCLQLVPLANRVLWRLSFDEALLQRYRCYPSPYPAEPGTERLHRWLEVALQFELTDGFLRQCHRVCIESVLPLGSAQDHRRAVVVQPWDAHEQMEGAYGTYGAAMLQHSITMPLTQIARDASHPWYQHVVLLTAHYILSQTTSVKLFQPSTSNEPPIVIPSYQLLKWHGELNVRKRLGWMVRRPLIVQLRKQWWVHHLASFYECRSASHALITWMSILQDEFNGELENETCISPWIRQVLT